MGSGIKICAREKMETPGREGLKMGEVPGDRHRDKDVRGEQRCKERRGF